MKKLTILITGVGGDIGQSIISCLEDACNSYDIEILGCDIDEYVAGKKKCSYFFKVPIVSKEEDYLTFIKSIIDER